MSLEVCRLIGHRAVGSGMALVEAVLSKEHHLIKEFIGNFHIDATLLRTLDKYAAVFLHLRYLLFTHRPTQKISLT